MLAIKLSRTGKNKEPHYRLLVLEKTKDPWGDFLENVGYVNTRTNPPTYNINKERIKHWISKGAQPTPTVHNILVSTGVIVAPKMKVSSLGGKFRAKLEAEKKAVADAAAKEKEAAKAAKAAEAAKAAAPAAEAKPAEAPKTEAPKA